VGGYTKLASSILTSTIWVEDADTRIVWITLLALANKDGEVEGSVPGLASIARVPVDVCREAIEKFMAPDPDSRTKDDEGRRIEEMDGGWVLLNHGKYRERASDDDRKQQAAARQQRARDRQKRNASRDSHAPSRTVTQESRQIPQADSDADADANTNTEAKSGRREREVQEREGPSAALRSEESSVGNRFIRFGQTVSIQ
jgi:hypothetical protein